MPPSASARAKSRTEKVGRERAIRAGLTYGPGALTAASRDDRLVWALHQAALERGLIPVVPAGVVAEAVRHVGYAEPLTEFLSGVETETLDGGRAVSLGVLATAAGTDNLVTAAVVETASRRNLAVVAERSSRMAELATALEHHLILHAL
jgi:hypothetical protein